MRSSCSKRLHYVGAFSMLQLSKHICNLWLCWSHSELKITVSFIILCCWFRVLSLSKHPLLLQEQPELNIQFQQFFLFSIQFLVRQVGRISYFCSSHFRRLEILVNLVLKIENKEQKYFWYCVWNRKFSEMVMFYVLI